MLAYGRTRLLLDLGRAGGVAPNPARIGRVDAVLLSHQHPDHCAALDLLPALGTPPVYATSAVADWLGLTAHHLPLSGQVTVGDFTLTTGRNGHAPGGVWLHLAAAGADTLFYAGDIMPDSPAFPFDSPPRARVAILDASYGLMRFAGDLRARFMARLCAAPRPLLLPAPATGRALEMALGLWETGLVPALCPATRRAFAAALDTPGLLRAEARAGCTMLLQRAGAADAQISLLDDPSLQREQSQALARQVRARGGAVWLSGHVSAGSPAADLLARAEAEKYLWPAHPDLAQNARLARRINAEKVLPAFCDATTARAFGSALYLPGAEAERAE